MARVRRLHPDPAELEAEELLDALDLPRADAQNGRPHVAVNMVVSVDGRTAVDGRSAPLTSPFDRALFHALRGAADAVIVGTRTLSAERYGSLVRDPQRRQERVARGLAALPLACVVTRSGDVDWAVPLFDDPEQPVVVFAPDGVAPPAHAAPVTVRHLAPTELDPKNVMRLLHADHGVRSLLCEGGATLNAALLDAGAADELFVSVAPVLAGGTDPLALVAGAMRAPSRLELRWMLESDGSVFLRYGVLDSGD